MIKSSSGACTLAVLANGNSKTGRMVQCYHMSRDLSAFLSGDVAGPLKSVLKSAEPCPATCPRSLAAGAAWGTCYARKTPLVSGLTSAMAAWVRHGRTMGTWADVVRLAASAAASIRFGAYGDPGTVDPAGVASACRMAREVGLTYTGYTHAWSEPLVSAELRGLLMASTEDISGARAAVAAGWKTALVSPHSLNRPDYAAAEARSLGRAVACPAQSKGLTCAQCRLCDGARVHVVFHEH
jgi:hypothetical protein